MWIVNLTANPNGSHNDHRADHITSVPDGWAMIEEGFPVPDTFPFLKDIKAAEKTFYRDFEKTRTVDKSEVCGYIGFDEDGNPLPIYNHYTEQETYTEQVPYTLMTVTEMTPGVIPEPVPEPEPEPTLDERNRADIDYLAVMMGVEL